MSFSITNTVAMYLGDHKHTWNQKTMSWRLYAAGTQVKYQPINTWWWGSDGGKSGQVWHVKMRVERVLGTFGRGSELADLRPVSRAFQRRFGWEVACWPANRQPVCLQIVLLPNGGSIQTIWYYMVSGSVLLVLSLELQSFDFQRAQVKPSVLNNEVSTVATSCAFPGAFFWSFNFFSWFNSAVAHFSILAHWSTN